jgi:magnesium-transporting ATPase (P-type)
MGILDQFISARLLDRYPQLYNIGQNNTFFRVRTFAAWIANAVYHSLILYIGGELMWPRDGMQSDGKIAGHWVWGTAMYASVLLTVLGKAALVTNNWTKYHVIAIPGSMVIWYIFVAVYATVAPMIGISTEYDGLVPRLFTSPVFWLQTFSLAIFALLRDFTWKYVKRMYYPQTYHHIQEIQKYNIQDYRPRYVSTLPLSYHALNTNHTTAWSNSKRPSAKSAKSSACENSVATPSRKQTSRRPESCKPTIPPSTVDGMARWLVPDRISRLLVVQGRAVSYNRSWFRKRAGIY